MTPTPPDRIDVDLDALTRVAYRARYNAAPESTVERMWDSATEMERRELRRMVEAVVDAALRRLTAEAEGLRQQVSEMREALLRADSKLSLLRHRGGIRWGTESVDMALGPVWEYDQVIGLVRRLSEGS